MSHFAKETPPWELKEILFRPHLLRACLVLVWARAYTKNTFPKYYPRCLATKATKHHRSSRVKQIMTSVQLNKDCSFVEGFPPTCPCPADAALSLVVDNNNQTASCCPSDEVFRHSRGAPEVGSHAYRMLDVFAMIAQAASDVYGRTIDPSPCLLPFESAYAPDISSQLYMMSIAANTGYGALGIELALVLLARFVAMTGEFPTPLTLHRQLLACLTVAAKANFDRFLKNSRVAELGGASLAELNELEVHFLFRIGFSCTVHAHDITAVRTAIDNICALDWSSPYAAGPSLSIARCLLIASVTRTLVQRSEHQEGGSSAFQRLQSRADFLWRRQQCASVAPLDDASSSDSECGTVGQK